MSTAPYVWTEQYQTAVLEPNPEMILARVGQAESSIRDRKEKLLHEASADAGELAAIAKALQVLAILRQIDHRNLDSGTN